jgi:hypothetical protein
MKSVYSSVRTGALNKAVCTRDKGIFDLKSEKENMAQYFKNIER